MSYQSQQSQRTVTAPAPSPALPSGPANRVLSVIVGADEDVEWVWTHAADGVSYVSGYTIVKKDGH